LILEGLPQPFVTPLTLTNSSYSPASGGTSTVFTFSTTYRSTDGSAPTSANLYVDNVAHPMSFIAGSYANGALFQASTTLTSGKHTYYFVFGNASGQWADPIFPAIHAGPSI